MHARRTKPFFGSFGTKADCILFVSSSGHCTLDCSYCLFNPIAKHEASLQLGDLEHLLDQVDGKCALAFTGKGDFFAGYRKNDELLARLLDKDVEIGLDINGVMIHEFPNLSADKLEKIVHINLTMHYSQLVSKNAIRHWTNNARTIIEMERCETFLMNMIMSPKEEAIWADALDFYEKEIFPATGQPIALIRDVHNLDNSFDQRIDALRLKHRESVADIFQVDSGNPFCGHDCVSCPAGKEFFRVWNDGRVVGCSQISHLVDCGNVTLRTFEPKTIPYVCDQPRFYDCQLLGKLNRMRDVSTGDIIPARSGWSASQANQSNCRETPEPDVLSESAASALAGTK